jgi:hypothetical protein
VALCSSKCRLWPSSFGALMVEKGQDTRWQPKYSSEDAMICVPKDHETTCLKVARVVTYIHKGMCVLTHAHKCTQRTRACAHMPIPRRYARECAHYTLTYIHTYILTHTHTHTHTRTLTHTRTRTHTRTTGATTAGNHFLSPQQL